MKLNLTVHVGLPRAASTFLQERIFPSLETAHYIGKSRSEYADWMKTWHYASDHAFNGQKDWIRKQLEASSSAHQPNILSSEMFTMWGNQTSTQAARLHAVAPEAKILLVLREPVDRMRSFYKAIVQHNDVWEPMESLMDWDPLPFVFYKRKPICLADYCYNQLIDAYGRYFPAEQISVQTFEGMTQDFRGFMGSLTRFLEIREDLTPILKLAQQRENSSGSDHLIQELRQSNAMSMIRSAKKVLNEAWECRRGGMGIPDWDLSPELRQKVRRHLSGHCDAYYPAKQATDRDLISLQDPEKSDNNLRQAV